MWSLHSPLGAWARAAPAAHRPPPSGDRQVPWSIPPPPLGRLYLKKLRLDVVSVNVRSGFYTFSCCCQLRLSSSQNETYKGVFFFEKIPSVFMKVCFQQAVKTCS